MMPKYSSSKNIEFISDHDKLKKNRDSFHRLSGSTTTLIFATLK